jgi:hypothetical protein
MTAITLTKLARRMLLLFLLGGVLAYLKAPTKAQAGEQTTCAECENDFTICVAKCDGDEECLELCHIEEQQCLAHCTE